MRCEHGTLIAVKVPTVDLGGLAYCPHCDQAGIAGVVGDEREGIHAPRGA